MKNIQLNNGVQMPLLGYGVYQVDPKECERCVSDAISVGYRMIDTAQIYKNEEGVGNAIKKSGIDRKEFFIVTKVWVSNAGYEKAKASIETSLRKLQTDVRGSMFGYFFTEHAVKNYDDALKSDTKLFAKFHQAMLRRGIYLAPSQFETGFICDAMSEADIDLAINAAKEAFLEIKA